MGGFLDRVFARIGALFRGKALDADLDEELAHHLEELAADNVRAGMTPDEALRRARVSLGRPVQVREVHREARGVPWLEQWLRDLRYAFRMYRRDLGFTAVALLIIAVGIGLNTTVFSLVNTVLLRPVPFADSDRLVWITNGKPQPGELSGETSEVDTWEGLKETTHSLDHIEGYFPFSVMQTYRLTGGGEPQTILSVQVTQGLFGLLGMRPLLGRLFLPEDAAKGAPARVMLSHHLWVRRFASNPNIVGETVQINGQGAEVIGVMPAADPFASVFFPAVPIDLYTAVQPDALRPEGNTLYLIGHRAAGYTEEQVEAELPVDIDRIKKKYPDRDQYIAAAGESLHDMVAGSLRKPVLFLWIASGFVLAIVGFNLAGLLLARGAARQREMALRVAIGAGRARIISQLLTECLGLVAVGASLGALAALGFVKFLSVRSAVQIPLLQYLKLDGSSLGYTALLCVLTAAAAGAVPAWKLSGGSRKQSLLGEDLRTSTGGRRRSRARNALVILEVSLAFALAVSAALMVMSLRNLIKVDLGFDPRHLIAVRIDPVVDGSHAPYIEAMLDRVRALPGVERAGVTDCIPVERDRSWGLYPYVPGQPDNRKWQGAHVRIVSPGLIGAMGTMVVAGRDFERGDAKGPPVVIINQTLAKACWPHEQALGKQVMMPVGTPNGGTKCIVIGIVGDVRSSGPEMGAGNEFYLTILQFPYASSWDLMVRTALPVNSLESELRDGLRSMDATLPLTKIREMQALVDRTLSSRRLLATLVGGFAAIAVSLALIGLYGVISYMVSQQRREIGIRLALGALPSRVEGEIMRRTVALALCGLALGLFGTLAGGRLIASLLFGISPSDPAIYGVAAAGLLACAGAAGYFPARRASRIDPSTALRSE